MLTGQFRSQVGEKVDILSLSYAETLPGNAVHEGVSQSQVACVLVRKSDNTRAAPTTTQTATYRCFQFEGAAPAVAQVLRRADGERLTILTKPEQFRGVRFFDCQHER